MSIYTYAPDPPESGLLASITDIDTSMEVDTIPSGVAAGDVVKCIIEQNHPHELVYGTVGTIGGGANGGTNITGLTRGAEGTAAAAHSSGAVVIVGAGGRNDVEAAGGLWSIASGQEISPIMVHRSAIESSTITEARVVAVPIWIPRRTTLTGISVEVTLAGSSDNDVRLGLYGERDGRPYNLVTSGSIAVDTTGTKTLSISETVPGGLYFPAITEAVNPTTRAEFGHDNQTQVLHMPLFSKFNYEAGQWKHSGTNFRTFDDPWQPADQTTWDDMLRFALHT